MNNRFTSHFSARALILAGLLCGLLISSGEGIHLFPFPVSAAAENLDPNANNGERIDYHENGQRVEKDQKKFETRFERYQESWAGDRSSLPNVIDRLQSIAEGPDLSAAPRPFRPRHFSDPIRGRAPPVS